jgi:hypothetical protein
MLEHQFFSSLITNYLPNIQKGNDQLENERLRKEKENQERELIELKKKFDKSLLLQKVIKFF